jgi:phospho-N-acetylmuramoyl-pentapeptide-transferase
MADMIVHGIALTVVACVLTLVAGYPLPTLLRRLGAGKIIREEEPESNRAKAGIPSMAGLLFTGATLVIGAGFIAPRYPAVWVLLLLLLGTATLGFIDDLSSTVRFRRGGLRARTKFAWLLLLSLAVAVLAQVTLHVHTLRVPFAGTINLGPFYLLLAVLAMVGMANAVNLTDGLDGLAGGTSLSAVLAYAVIALVRGEAGVGFLLLTMAGALLGFLWYNVHPAAFIMGDTGSLALGALLAGAAMLTGDLLVLVVVGAVFVAETLSVMIQVAYFKHTGGRRFFRLSPLHYHFKLGGWSETRVVQRFWLLGAVAAVAGVGLALA